MSRGVAADLSGVIEVGWKFRVTFELIKDSPKPRNISKTRKMNRCGSPSEDFNLQPDRIYNIQKREKPRTLK
jgi:hypothetical protein